MINDSGNSGNNRDEFHNPDIEQKKPDTEKYMQYDTMYRKLKTRQSLLIKIEDWRVGYT